jgi:uncharacterized SAM-binding protein YcdF (DUF218 family)
MKHLLRGIAGLCLIFFSILVIEGIYFFWMFKVNHPPLKTDAIIVFMGSEKRIVAAYNLANQGLASFMVFSPAKDRIIKSLDKKFNLRSSITYIPEEQATTTFENALFASQIIDSHQWKTVTLMTSDYHMPRSFALLKMFLAGKIVHIRQYPVHSDEPVKKIVLFKLIYNEMLEFWGCLVECVVWKTTGKLPAKPFQKNPFVVLLKSLLLTNVQPTW